jgi:hypothetical protein
MNALRLNYYYLVQGNTRKDCRIPRCDVKTLAQNTF